VFTLDTGAPQSSIHEVFEFVEDDCDLTIEAVPGTPPPVQAGTIGLTIVTATPADAFTAPVKPGGSFVASATGDVNGIAVKPADTVVPAPAAVQSIRVDVDKVDRLVNLVGEMVITQAMLTEQGTLLPADQFPTLIQGIEALAQSARELQESVMAIRAQPVKSVFARMPRVVRDLALTLGKEVRIVTTGEMTEIDKTVIEQLNDPLTHMIRNALDHGIEMPHAAVASTARRS
jgi:two-component system chemotaxis sensor kinase CheA